jgi:hypothetical protein
MSDALQPDTPADDTPTDKNRPASPATSSSEDPTLEIGTLQSKSNIEFPTRERGETAHNIIVIFGAAILGSLILNFLLIVGLVVRYQCQSDQIDSIVNKGIIPLLTATGTLASTVFGPLLAFILGYYFSQKNVSHYYGHNQQMRAPGRPHGTEEN